MHGGREFINSKCLNFRLALGGKGRVGNSHAGPRLRPKSELAALNFRLALGGKGRVGNTKTAAKERARTIEESSAPLPLQYPWICDGCCCTRGEHSNALPNQHYNYFSVLREPSPLHASRLLSYSSDGVLMVLKRLLQLLGKLALGVNVAQESRELRHGGCHPKWGCHPETGSTARGLGARSFFLQHPSSQVN